MSSKKNTKTDLMTIRRGSTTCNNPKQSQELQDVNSLPTIAFVNKSKHRFKALLEQMDKESNLTLNERFNIFVSETSFTALTKIFKAQNILKSMIWLILTLGMMTWLCIQCYSLFSKYFSYPYEVTIGRESVSQMEFPSVTICNRNPVKKSKYENSPFEHYNDTFKLSKNSLLFDKALAMMKNGSSPPSEENGGSSPEEDLVYMRKMIDQKFDVWQALNDSATAKQYYNTDDDEIVAAMTYSGIASEMQQQKLKSYGHQLEEFLVSCRFAGLPCSPTNFTYINNAKYGNCYTFNAFNNDKETLYSSYAGPMMGLALELNVQQNEYMPSLAPDAGVRALVHARGTYPAIEDDGFSIPVGTVTSVGVLTEFMDFKLTHMSLDYMSMDERPESDENMVKLEVYFRELVVENVEQQKSYESQNLISDVGGQLGLWLGLSAITIGEVIEFVIAIFKAVTTKVVRRNKKDTAVESF